MIVSLSQAAAMAGRLRRDGQSLVFTNGVFDLLHPGHVRYLQSARREGDALIVGVNSDRSVRAIKGSGRPVVTDVERAEVVAALDCVDAVLIFDEHDPGQVIDRLRPSVLVKGADWPADHIVGRERVEADGGRVVRVPFTDSYSTSAIIRKIKNS